MKNYEKLRQCVAVKALAFANPYAYAQLSASGCDLLAIEDEAAEVILSMGRDMFPAANMAPLSFYARVYRHDTGPDYYGVCYEINCGDRTLGAVVFIAEERATSDEQLLQLYLSEGIGATAAEVREYLMREGNHND